MNQIKTNSFYAWVLASRPKTLAGAAIPVMVGSSLVYMNGSFKIIPAVICLLFAFLMQIAANLINDLYDFLKGSDREDRLGPERSCAQGWITPSAMKKGIFVTILLACGMGSVLLLYAGWELIIVGIICVLFAFLYTTGPYPLSYNGWGDLLVIVFFGFIPVCGTYYVQADTISTDVIIGSLICGFIVDTLLVVNNYRDREADAKSGKKTIIVRLGKTFGEYLYLSLGVIASFLCFYFIFEGNLVAAFIPQLYLIFHIRTWKKMVKIQSGKALNAILGETSQNMLIMGGLLSIGLIVG